MRFTLPMILIDQRAEQVCSTAFYKLVQAKCTELKIRDYTNSVFNGYLNTPGVGDGQGGLACCNSWGHKELDPTERLN